jgi:hypothetical protein
VAREDHGFAKCRARIAARPREIEIGQCAGGARAGMRAEYGEAVGALDELHGRAPARIDLDDVGNCVARNEVDAVDADEAERIGRRAGKRAGGVADRCVARELWIAVCREDVSTVLKAGRAERGVADQLAEKTDGHGVAAGSDEHNRARHTVDELL